MQHFLDGKLPTEENPDPLPAISNDTPTKPRPAPKRRYLTQDVGNIQPDIGSIQPKTRKVLSEIR